MTSVPPTAASVLHSGIHGRQRRHERNIEKIDLQRARRYGMQEPARNGRVKYTYGGVVFIYDPISNREVTSFRSADISLETSGTKCAKPVILSKHATYEDDFMLAIREQQRTKVWRARDSWTSHSVLVVDMSGSMRRDDVNGARCRSDGVWMALARDYVQKPLQNKTRSKTDLISVVVMKDAAHVVMKYEPIDWVLYNKLIDLREWNEIRPSGPGNYMPALYSAEKLLATNQRGSCSLSLMFFSDGRPSDRGDFSGRMGEIAARFGRRLSVACIGMAEVGEDFSTLNDMVTEAQSYGAVASFGKPSLDADSLSNIITSLATSLTTSKTEMTNMATGEARKVRMDITRERAGTPDDICLTSDWTTYRTKSYKAGEQRYVTNCWSWNHRQNDFVQLLDSRCKICWEETNLLDETGKAANGIQCPHCEGCCFCWGCYTTTNVKHHRTSSYQGGPSDCSGYLKNRRLGKIRTKPLPSRDVAVKQTVFGEGAERIVRKFRFLDERGSFIGPVMVAKESRFLENDGAHSKRMDFHREFMHTQDIAAEYAKYFKEALSDIAKHFSDDWVADRVARMPRIMFLEPMVVETQDPSKEDTEYNILVERMLEGKYEKFNDNMGMVRGKSRSVSVDELSNEFGSLGLNDGRSGGGGLGGLGLGAIEEGSEDEESDDENEIADEKKSRPKGGSYDFSLVKNEDVPQAFSHFTYQKSKKRFMVVDLQGVLKVNRDGTSCYELTDPVIHKHRKKNKKKFKQWSFGRTDRGEKGMKAFFHTHKCNEVCRLLGLEEVKM